MQRLRFPKLALVGEEHCHAADGSQRGGMLIPQVSTIGLKGFTIQRFRFRRLALLLEKSSKIENESHGMGMVVAQDPTKCI